MVKIPSQVSGSPCSIPRIQKWEEHFQWSEQSPFTLVGTSTHGRATVVCLQMNHSNLLNIRRLLADLNIPWKVGVQG